MQYYQELEQELVSVSQHQVRQMRSQDSRRQLERSIRPYYWDVHWQNPQPFMVWLLRLLSCLYFKKLGGGVGVII